MLMNRLCTDGWRRRCRPASMALLLATAVAANAAEPLPVAAVRPVTDTFFGTPITDPYRYFENIEDPEVAKWMKAQSDHAHDVLSGIAGRSALLTDLQKYDGAVAARVGSVTRVPGGLWFYEKRGAGDNQFKLYSRRGLDGAETVLVDPDELEKRDGVPHAINYYTPSPDGRYVAYGMSRRGSESASLAVLDTRSGKLVGTPIPRADYGFVDWAPDGRSLLFTRLQAMKPGMAETEKYQRSAVFRLRIAGGRLEPQPVFDARSAGVTMTPIESPMTSTTDDGRWVIGSATNGTQRELQIYVASQDSVRAGNATWRRVVSRRDAVTGFAYSHDALYLLTHKGAPRSRIERLDLRAAASAAPKTVVPEGERVLTGLAAASDALYIEARQGNAKQLWKLGYEGDGRLEQVRLPIEGGFELGDDESNASAADARLPGVVIELQGWTQARRIFHVDAIGDVHDTGLQPAGPYDAPADIEAEEVLVKSHDGAMVPMSILYRKGIALDGSNPTLLYGYGAYGITEEPSFNASRLAWLDAGGVYAVANPRGSGVFGEAWYQGGLQGSKPNTWKDFIACAEALIARGYTKPARLGIMGGSAGGILVGRAMTERPDLFAAVVSVAGALDTLRAEFTPNGVPNIPEFGSVRTAAGFKALQAMSAYDHVQAGTAYPALLLVGGTNDPRVEVWESTKMAARMQAATSSGKPVLLRLDYDAGHGIGSTKAQQLEQRADIYAFLLWQLGVKGYEASP